MRLGSVSIRLGRWLEIHSRRRPIDAATRSADCTLGAILESLSRLALIRFLFLFLFVSVFFLPSLFPCFGLLFLSVRSAPRFYLMPSFFFLELLPRPGLLSVVFLRECRAGPTQFFSGNRTLSARDGERRRRAKALALMNDHRPTDGNFILLSHFFSTSPKM